MSFPAHLLRKDDAVLSLFVAAYAGAQDLVHVRDAGCRNVIAVDNDAVKLDAMRAAFPDFLLHHGDAFTFVEALELRSGHKFDFISADPWTGDMEPRMLTILPALLEMTERVLVLGFSNAMVAADGPVQAALLEYEAKTEAAFSVEVLQRTDLASWVVIEFAEV